MIFSPCQLFYEGEDLGGTVIYTNRKVLRSTIILPQGGMPNPPWGGAMTLSIDTILEKKCGGAILPQPKGMG